MGKDDDHWQAWRAAGGEGKSSRPRFRAKNGGRGLKTVRAEASATSKRRPEENLDAQIRAALYRNPSATVANVLKNLELPNQRSVRDLIKKIAAEIRRDAPLLMRGIPPQSNS